MVRAVTTERTPSPTIESITTAVRSAAGELRNGRQGTPQCPPGTSVHQGQPVGQLGVEIGW